MDTNTSKKTRRIVIGSLLATAALIAVLSDGDDVDQTEVGNPGSDVQFYEGGTITTGENGEVIVSGTDGSSYSYTG